MTAGNPETLHQQLKKQTSALHEKAHRIAYISSLLKSTIPLESYVGHLRAFAIIYGTLEHQLSVTKNPETSAFLEGYTLKLPLILADLETMNASTVKDIIPAVSIALHIADRILLFSEKNPYKLIGFLYTLDGSLNGGSVFKKHLSEIFGLQNDQGTSYFSAFNGQFKQFWKDFTGKLNTQISEKRAQDDVLSAAHEIFVDIMEIYERLYPVDARFLGNHVTSLNPEAGNFPISTNPFEIKAAIKAGLNCWNAFPFYEKRYGDRGRRFAVSDSAWLVTLCDLPDELAYKQVKWLANYLAVKGMPTLTMEIQLQFLYHELVKQTPENKLKYRKLRNSSALLEKERTDKVADPLFDEANAKFEDLCKQLKVSDNPLSNTGKLIAASVADSRNGLTESATDFKSWVTDPKIFSHNWITAVEKTYSAILNQI